MASVNYNLSGKTKMLSELLHYQNIQIKKSFYFWNYMV
jgi:hypothetical protein